jgi:ArsR family transcriptional regulator
MTGPDELSRIFKALADPNRLAILQRLRECCGPGCCLPEDDEGTVSVLAQRLGLAVSTVSFHLKELRTAGLITCEKRGRYVHCAVNPEAMRRIQEFVGSEQE